MFSADAPTLAAPGRDLAGFSADLATFVAEVEEDVIVGAPARSTKLPIPDFAEESKVRFSDVITEEDASLPARVCRAHVAGTARAFSDEIEEANDEFHDESVVGGFPQVAVDDPESGVVWTHDVSLQLEPAALKWLQESHDLEDHDARLQKEPVVLAARTAMRTAPGDEDKTVSHGDGDGPEHATLCALAIPLSCSEEEFMFVFVF